MIKFKDFLRYASLVTQNANSMDLNICIGNKAADMDSVVGSLILSYSLTQAGILTIPHINCSKAELCLRTETYKLLEQHRILSLLQYHDYTQFQRLQSKNHIGIVLFDHNFPDISQQYLDMHVRAIVDHHWDYRSPVCKHKLIKRCGSACSLAISLYGMNTEWDMELAQLAISPILLDCENFNPRLQNIKWNHIDVEAFRILSLHLKSIDTNLYYEKLKDMLYDVETNLKLGIDNLLIKDYKCYPINNTHKYGSSVVSIAPKTLFTRYGTDSFWASIKQLMLSKQIDFYILNWLCTEQAEKVRVVMFICNSKALLDELKRLIDNACLKKEAKLNLIEPPNGLNNCLSYNMRNMGTTRKGMEPALNDIFKRLFHSN